MNSPEKRLSIILASYNDARIERAIKSVRYFDDIGTVRLVVIDGGSRSDVIDVIRPLLTPDDIFISEPDRGIFDALNKGLDNCSTEFIGWLGSDDLFTGCVRASEVVAALESHDIFIADLAFFRGSQIRRVMYAKPCRYGLVNYGVHNPHYATFGRACVLKRERFDLTLMGSDIIYFNRIFDAKPSVATVGKVVILQYDGGYSNLSSRKIMQINWQLVKFYAKHRNPFIALLYLLIKMSYKIALKLRFTLFPVSVRRERFPVLSETTGIDL